MFSVDDDEAQKSFETIKEMVEHDPIFSRADRNALKISFWTDLKQQEFTYFSQQQAKIASDIEGLKATLESARISYGKSEELRSLLDSPLFARLLTKLESLQEKTFKVELKAMLEKALNSIVAISKNLPIKPKEKSLPAVDFIYFLYMRLFGPSTGSSSNATNKPLPISWKKINQRLGERGKKEQNQLLSNLKAKTAPKDWKSILKLLAIIGPLLLLVIWVISGKSF